MPKHGRHSAQRFTFVLSVVCSAWNLASAPRQAAPAGCVRFVSPTPGAVLTVPSCTVMVNVCPVVKSIRFRAAYYRKDGLSKDTVDLGTVAKAPFKIVWPLASVPNQLVNGVLLIAEARYVNSESSVFKQEGVFLAHQPIVQPSLDISAGISGPADETGTAVALSGKPGSRSSSARLHLDNQQLVVSFTVEDTAHRATITAERLRATWCEVLIDPVSSAAAYPTDGILALQAPLQGDIQQRRYQPLFTTDGGYALGTRLEPYAIRHIVKMVDGRGWKLICRIPLKLLGGSMPERIRCNLIVRVTEADASVSTYSWSGNGQEIYAPISWGTIVLKGMPLTRKPLPMYLFGLVGGLLIVFAGYAVALHTRRVRGMVLSFETPEGEKKIVELIQGFIDGRVSDKSFSLQSVSDEFSIEPQRVDRLLRKYAEKPFTRYIMELRVEAAKERLRSSNAAEASIAEQCGFRSVSEMEHMFLKHGGVTPYRFRLEQQVT